ncbi:28238_t:CDS:1, partial [Dentiscutata erythropus]
SGIFNAHNLVYNLEVQGQVIVCRGGSSTDSCCQFCYVGIGLAGCCSTYIDCLRISEGPNTCKTAYYTCADRCATVNGISCDSRYAQRCSRGL